MPGDPSIHVVVVGQKATLECTIQSASELGAEYNVTWSSDAFTLRSTVLTTTVVDSLSVNDLATQQKESVISNGVTCSVTAYNPSRCGNGVSPPLSSSLDPFSPVVNGPADLTIEEGRTSATISVSFGTITPDLYCFLKYGEACTVTIQARTSTLDETLNKCIGGDPVPVVVVKSVTSNGQANTCGGDLPSSNPAVDLVIKAVSDGIIREDKVVEVRVAHTDTITSSGTRAIDGDVLGTFKITVRSELFNGQCKVIGDPHIFTYDLGKYDNMMAGEFILYKHNVLDVEIHGYFYLVGEGSSACGFAARIGTDVVKISKCETRDDDIHPVTVRLYRNGDGEPLFKVFMEDDGDTFKVYLPTGALMMVRNSVDASLNLYINPSAKDIGNVEGACGSFDNDKLNDLFYGDGLEDQGVRPNNFSNFWRVPDGQSIYSGYSGVSALSVETYCSCDFSGESQCTDFGDVSYCSLMTAESRTDITDILLEDSVYERELEEQTTTRKKRQTTTTSGGFTYTTNPLPPSVVILESQAVNVCRIAVEAMDSYDICKTYSQDSYASDIESCALDIVITGQTDWAAATVQNLQQSCIEAIASNATRWAPDPAPTDPNVFGQLDPITINQLCPSDCNGRSVCEEGICTSCTTGFTGADCGIDTTVVPTIQLSATSSLCAENRIANCNVTIVNGINFLPTATCILTPIVVNANTWTRDGPVVSVPARYRSLYRVLCDLPTARSYSVGISNDGNRVSETGFFVVHDSCFDCSVGVNGTDPACTLQSDSCYIDGVCIDADDFNARDQCQVCDPSKSQSEWSRVEENDCNVIEPPTSTAPSTLGPDSTSEGPTGTTGPTTERDSSHDSVEFNSLTVIIVSSCIAALLLIFIVVFVVILTVRRQRLKSATNMSSSMSEEDESYERVFNGSFGLRTDKNLTFYNPSLTPSFDYYDNSI